MTKRIFFGGGALLFFGLVLSSARGALDITRRVGRRFQKLHRRLIRLKGAHKDLHTQVNELEKKYRDLQERISKMERKYT